MESESSGLIAVSIKLNNLSMGTMGSRTTEGADLMSSSNLEVQ